MPLRRRALAAVAVTITLSACGTTVPGAQSLSPAEPGAAANGLELPAVTGPGPTDGGTPSVEEGDATIGVEDDPVGGAAPLAHGPARPGSPGAPVPGSDTTAGGGPRTPLLVGVEIIKNGDAAFKTIGLGVTYGDQAAQVDAVIKHINANGGAGGRPVTAVLYENDLQSSTSYAGREQEACTLWAEDKHVAVAVSPLTHGPLLAECLRRHGIPLLNSGATVDDAALSAVSTLFLVNRLSLTRAMSLYVDSLVSSGFLTAKSKVGVIYADAEPFRRVKARDLQPALAQHGLRIEREAAIDIVNQQAFVSGSQNAVLQFASAGIDRVLFVEVGGGLPYMFATSAEGQGYRPKYGLTSDNAPAYLAGALPAAQLDGATGVGWLPFVDAGQQGARLAPAGAECLQIHSRNGQTPTSDTQAKFMAELCDLLLFTQVVLAKTAGRSEAPAFIKGAEALGDGFRSAATFAVEITDRRHDGAVRARPLAYSSSCECFRYTGGERRVA